MILKRNWIKHFLLGNSLYILDAKDYHGNYAYNGGQWYCNDKKLENNILYQLQRAKTILESFLKMVGLSDLKVRGALIFTAGDCRLAREGTLAEEVVMENQIASWLSNKSQLPFVTDEKVKRQLKAALEDKQQARVKTALAVEADTLGDMKQGICCESCRSFDLEKKHHMLVCRNCGHEESKEKAYVRTICEFGLIFHEEELTIGRVSHFFGRGWSRDSIKRMLKKHFNSTDKKGKASSYGNFGLDFEEWFEEEQEYFKKTEERLKWKQR